MTVEAYKEITFRDETWKLVRFMNRLIDEYIAQGFKLSVRQLYYQLVARDVVENTERSYKRVASIINDARVGGYMDWDVIEDRGRDIEMRTRWDSGQSIVNAAAQSFHMDHWDNQRMRLFVVVEKAALAGVLEPTCRKYDVPMLAARGYPSVSVVREFCVDHFIPAAENGQHPYVLHLGDHDPSGIDMTRDLEDRITMFCLPALGRAAVSIDRIALNMGQIEEKNPPPNPAKTTDARFREYRRRFGDESWELDALEPAYLVSLIEQRISEHIDADAWKTKREEIEGIRARLKRTARDFKD